MKLILLFALTLPSWADPIFQEKGGLLAIEAESTSSPLGKWKKKFDVRDFSGECHLEFTGNKTESGPPNSPLKYKFTISKGGKYSLAIRSRKRLESKRADISNDCYISLKGNFDTGGKAPLKVLKEDTKLFGGDADKWGWAKTLDTDGRKLAAEYLLEPGETYQLTIHGRSKNFNIDRFLLVHESRDFRKEQQKNPPESKPAGPVIKERLSIQLTNKSGVTIKAELISLENDTLTFVAKGRRHRIKLDTLIEDDQKAVRKWAE
ncbi:hypothetical protein N9A86_03190 [Akkermansiaceae bacterium]|nr:hypothetical protein [Akkermansiaceae bacterium]